MVGHTKVSGPMAVLADGFRAELERLGYTPSSREFKLAEVAKLSAWLESRGLGVGSICRARIEALLPRLSTYLGHREPRFSYRYLTATPELLGHAAARLEAAQETTR